MNEIYNYKGTKIKVVEDKIYTINCHKCHFFSNKIYCSESIIFEKKFKLDSCVNTRTIYMEIKKEIIQKVLKEIKKIVDNNQDRLNKRA